MIDKTKGEVLEECLQKIDQLKSLMLERMEVYARHSDFNATHLPSKAQMDLMKKKTSDVNRIHNEVNKLRGYLGTDSRTIKKQDVRRLMTISDEDARCDLLFKARETVFE